MSSSSSSRTSRTHSPSRRDFLMSASAAAVGASFAGRSLFAAPARGAMHSAASFLPDRVPDNELRGFASAAIDAAKSAGASYADIRIADAPTLWIFVPTGNLRPAFAYSGTFGFGIRAIVDGASAFVYCANAPSLDAVTSAARDAVASARGISGGLAWRPEFVPAPVVTGAWETPMTVDPFTVPVEAHWDVVGSYIAMAERVKYGSVGTRIEVTWKNETRVFASTEGSMITQQFHTADFHLGVTGRCVTGVDLPLAGPLRASGGFELATDPALHALIVRRTEEAARLAMIPETTLDVGRYDVVVAGTTMANLVGRSLAPALEIDRALGHEAGGAGTSYLAPPLEVLGQPLFSPLLTLTNDRGGHAAECARWDDEGVACEPVTLIDQGRVVDFFTSRMTAGALRPWYEKMGKRVGSNGSMNSPSAWEVPVPRSGHVSVRPSAGSETLDDLCRGIKRGVLIYDGGAEVDQQLASMLWRVNVGFEITNGRLGRRIAYNGLQSDTRRLWSRSLKAIGSAATIEHSGVLATKSQPLQWAWPTASAPAGRFAEVDVIRTRG